MKEWAFAKPIPLLVIKKNGKHYAMETTKGWVEKEDDVLVNYVVNNVLDLKNLRAKIVKGEYFELASAPVCDQLWAAIAQRTGFIQIIDEEENDES